MWEDERNRRGGRWLITLSKQQRKSDLDQFWLETVRSCSDAGISLIYRQLCYSRNSKGTNNVALISAAMAWHHTVVIY